MISNVDANIGWLIAKLKELKIEDNTIVVFLSDNGPRTKRTKNDLYPDRYVMNLRGTKTSVYENGIHAPFFIKWPAKIPKGLKLNNLTAHIDLLPTLLDACNVPVPENLKLDGISFLPLLTGKVKELPERNIFIQGHAGSEPFKYVHFTVRGQKYKLISPHDEPYEIVHRPNAEEIKNMIASLELYDIEKDPSEIHNIAKQKPEIVEDLLAKYEKWFDEVIYDRGYNWPQRIHLGSKFQNNVELSTFEWGGPGTTSGKGKKLGYWEVYSNAANYRISFKFQKTTKPVFAVLKYMGKEYRLQVNVGTSQIVFDEISLPEGNGRFEAYFKSSAEETGVQFVNIDRLN